MWKNIKSAPRDGTDILLLQKSLCNGHDDYAYFISIAFFSKCPNAFPENKGVWLDLNNQDDDDDDDNGYGGFKILKNPTHWQSLPEMIFED
jgi:hypothetical protein